MDILSLEMKGKETKRYKMVLNLETVKNKELKPRKFRAALG